MFPALLALPQAYSLLTRPGDAGTQVSEAMERRYVPYCQVRQAGPGRALPWGAEKMPAQAVSGWGVSEAKCEALVLPQDTLAFDL